MIPWIVAWRVVVSMPQSKESRRFFSVEAVALPNLRQTFRGRERSKKGYAVYLCTYPHSRSVARAASRASTVKVQCIQPVSLSVYSSTSGGTHAPRARHARRNATALRYKYEYCIISYPAEYSCIHVRYSQHRKAHACFPMRGGAWPRAPPRA